MSAPPGYPYPAFGPPLPPPRRRGLWITLIVLAVLLVLGGGGGVAAYLATRNPDGKGQATPQDAVDRFLQAVYVDQSSTKAAPLVCKAARDPKKLSAKVDEIKHQSQQYDNPKYAWSYVRTDSPTKTQAVVSTKITLTTDDVQTATETIKVTTIRSDGWFVCDVAPA
jgi:flagellar basal body-associated protein FliL